MKSTAQMSSDGAQRARSARRAAATAAAAILAITIALTSSGPAAATSRSLPRAARARLAGPSGGRSFGLAPDGAQNGVPDIFGFHRPLFGFGSALVGSAPTGKGPSLLAVDPVTHTVYVVNGTNTVGPNQGGNTVSVIDTRRCNAWDVRRCPGPWPTITVGSNPSSVAVDRGTDTVYVTNSGDFTNPGTVSVVNGATCNAQDSSGCGQTPAEVPVGVGPVGISADRDNHTVYVTNAGANTVSMINSATCTGTHLSHCLTTDAPTVTVGNGPGSVDADLAKHTVYAALTGGVAVFDADTCNATTQAGCGHVATLPGDPAGFGAAAAVDRANQTLYTANGDQTISVFDLRTCNASDLAGCASDAPGTLTIAGPPGFDGALAVLPDTANHTVYVAMGHDDALMVFDANACNGRQLAVCAAIVPHEIHTGTEPESIGLDPRTQTLYTGDEVDNTVSVIDASRCDAGTTVGCRPVPPTIAFPQPAVSIDDPAVHTVYVPSQTGVVGMLDTTTCNARRPAGCPRTPVTFTGGAIPFSAIVNPETHTVYIANAGNGSDGSVSVIDDRTCNATTRAGCTGASLLRLPAGAEPIAVDVDWATNTIYAAAQPSGGPGSPAYLYVFNGATCEAANRTGCGQTPTAIPLSPGGPTGVAVDQATHTAYVAMIPAFGSATPGIVDLIDGATCNGTRSAGCAGPIATVTVGVDPQQVGVDQATNTVYTANEEDMDYQGTASIFDGSTCNSTDTGGCRRTATTVPVGFGPLDLWVDQNRNQVWVENTQDTSVSIIDGAVCNGRHQSGCARPWAKRSVLDYPNAVAFADRVGTAYVSGWAGISLVREHRAGRPG